MDAAREHIRESIGKCVFEAFLVVAEGSIEYDADRKKVHEMARSSLSFPNKNAQSVEGKPQDVEIRFALAIFHRMRRTKNAESIELISDMGLSRQVMSAKKLAELLLLPLEAACRREGLTHDVRLERSGIIGVVTVERSFLLRRAGKLPCPLCTKWCLGEKGLWWHQQQNHQIEHSIAVEVAASSTDVWAIIPYDPIDVNSLVSSLTLNPAEKVEPDAQPLDFVKEGNLAALKVAVDTGSYNPSQEMDPKGASPIMWAAGGGHLETVQYLVEVCGCNPNQPQQGKRSFSGRTPLHWAARNGHLPVVRYLVEDCHCQVDLEASTIDGTTSFGWASWQGQLEIMEYLHNAGCNIRTINSFGCNAVLWAAQGKGDIVIMEWLQAKGCEMTRVNKNGHAVFHKSAQRGHLQSCQWFFEKYVNLPHHIDLALSLIGPDTEGYCASDLAGMGGHEELAKTLAQMEMDVISNLKNHPVSSGDLPDLPAWLEETKTGISMKDADNILYSWGKYEGVRRMRSKL